MDGLDCDCSRIHCCGHHKKPTGRCTRFTFEASQRPNESRVCHLIRVDVPWQTCLLVLVFLFFFVYVFSYNNSHVSFKGKLWAFPLQRSITLATNLYWLSGMLTGMANAMMTGRTRQASQSAFLTCAPSVRPPNATAQAHAAMHVRTSQERDVKEKNT